MKKLFQNALLLLFAASLSVYAEAPNLLTYQGRLKEGGQAVSGNRAVEILLCDDVSAGTCNTSGTQSVTVSNGLFRSTFTVPVTANFGAGNWYLEIWVAGTQLLPRERLTSNAYSLFSATATYATNIAAATGSDGVYISSNLYVNAGGKYYGDGSQLTNLPVSGGAVTKTGDTMTGTLTINAASALTSGNQAELVISTNIYIVGYSSATKYYGDGSALTGLTAAQVGLGSLSNIAQLPASYLDTDNTLAANSDAKVSSQKAIKGYMDAGLGSKQPYDADLITYAGITPSANVQSLLGSADYAAARTNIGLAIGANVQAWDADLDTLGGNDGSSLLKVSSIAVGSVYDGALLNPKVSKTGDTITGQLTLAGSTLTITGNAFSVGASTLVVVGGKVGINIVNPEETFHVQSSTVLFRTVNNNNMRMVIEGNTYINPSLFAELSFENTNTPTRRITQIKSYRVGDSFDTDLGFNLSDVTGTVLERVRISGSNGVLTAAGFAGNLTGNVTGNISGSAGSATGNSGTATALATARAINGVNFDGSAAIVVPVNSSDDTANAGTMYPLWTSAAGNYAAKLSTTKLSFVPDTGILTAVGFAGNLAGNVTGNTFSVGGSTLVVNAGRVGIGTTSPGEVLSILSNASNGQNIASFRSGSTGLYLQNNTTRLDVVSYDGAGYDPMMLRATSGTPQIYLATSGNVGIGTAAPTAVLNVNGTTLVNANYPLLLSDNNPYGAGFRNDQAGSESFIIAARNSATKIFLATGYDVSASPGSAIALPANPEITIDNGEVGIGNASPGFKLDVNGDVNLAGGSVYRIGGVAQSGTSKWTAGAGDDIYKNLGNVGIGILVPAAKLDVQAVGSGQTDIAQIWRNSGGAIVSSVSATGVMMAANFVGDGSKLTGIIFDNLGNHTATQNLNLSSFDIGNISTVTLSSITSSGVGVVFSTNVLVMSGGLGINTAFPQESLDVNGNIKSTSLSGFGDQCVYANNTGKLLLSGVGSCGSAAGLDNMGNHTMLSNLKTGSNWISFDGSNGGLSVNISSNVGIGVLSAATRLDIQARAGDSYTQIWRNAAGVIQASMSATGVIYVDASGLRNISGDNLGNHTASQNLSLAGYTVTNISTITILNGSIAIVPLGTGGSNNAYGISIGSDSSNNYSAGIGVGQHALDNYNSGVGVGYNAYSNYGSGVGIGNNSTNNYDSGVGIGHTAESNYTAGVGVGNNAFNNYVSGVGVGDNAKNNHNNGVGVGGGAANNYTGGVGLGWGAAGNNTYGVGVGNNASTNNDYGIGIGDDASNNNYSGIGIGRESKNNYNFSVGVGAYSANNKEYGSALGAYSYAASSSVALGSYAKANAEQSIAIGNQTVNNSTGTASFGSYAVLTASAVTAAYYQINGSTVLAILNGTGSLGLGSDVGRLNTGNKNVFIGYQAGYSNNTGDENSFVGNVAGYTNSTGDFNSFVGYQAGYFNTTGNENSFLGDSAGYENTTGRENTFIGSNTGIHNTEGLNNSFFGSQAGSFNNTGSDNSIVGQTAGYYSQAGSANVIFGKDAGYGVSNNSFSSSTLVGYRAGFGLTTGSNNILLGFQAGDSLTTGIGNIIIGYNQDSSAPAVNNELNIGGLLFGDLSAKTLGISTRVPQAALDVVSTGTASSVYAQIWRDSAGVIVSSVSSTGVMMASKFIGDGSGLISVTPLVMVSSGSAAAIINLVADTEKLVASSTITISNADTKILIMGNVAMVTNTSIAATPQARVRRSNAGGACSITSTIIYTHSGQHGATSGHPIELGFTTLDAPGTAGTYAYCVGVISAAANILRSRTMTLMEVSPNSSSSLSAP